MQPTKKATAEKQKQTQNGLDISATGCVNATTNANCTMCGQREPQATVLDLSSNEIMKATLATNWKLPMASAESTLASVCVQCVYKINAHTEMTRSLEVRLQHHHIDLTPTAAQRNSRKKSRRKTEQPRRHKKAAELPTSPSATSTPITWLPDDGAASPNQVSDVALFDPLSTPETPGPARGLNKDTDEVCPDATPTSTSALLGSDARSSITPPPYSPHQVGSGDSGPTTPQQSSPTRPSYVVEVEDITPEKELQPPPPLATASHSLVHADGESNGTRPSPNARSADAAQPVHPPLSPTVPNSPSCSHSSMLQEPADNNHMHQHQSMLRVFRERCESTSVTESGGQITRQAVSHLVCQFCSQEFLRKTFAKHTRRCPARYRNARSRSKLAKSRRSASTFSHANGVDPLSEPERSRSVRRLFYCSECTATTESMAQLRVHRRTHLRQHHCDTCGNDFTAVHDYDFHRAVCAARHAVSTDPADGDAASQREPDERGDGEEKNITPPSTMRVTRSRSRAAISRGASPAGNTSEWQQGRRVYNDDDDDDDADEDVVDDANDADYNNDDNGNNDDSDYDGGDRSDDTGDDVSLADTMYTKRMRFTDDWVADHRRKSAVYSPPRDDILYDEETQMNTYKEYDLYLLAHLKAQILHSRFTCLVPGCNFVADKLLGIMLHDYLDHYKGAWFYCQKCGCVFTSKVFLDYHLDRQNGGRFICFKCGDIFEFQHQLDVHLLQHAHRINYRCNYCKLEFLSEELLMLHRNNERHYPNSERALICIDPSMTITQEQPLLLAQRQQDEAMSARQGCIMRYMEMKLPPMPSLRPMTLPGHKPYRRQIGDMAFKNQKYPNCWGWK